MLTEGDLAPDFELRSDEDKTVRLSDFRDRPVVLYFYPKDDTPGCTRQACSFRDAFAEFRGLDAAVLGISPDSEASHARFRAKYDLPFTLLSDPDHQVAESYGAWGEKTISGKTSIGIIRSSFVVDAEGKVAKALVPVSPEDNVAAALAALGAP
jgi:thioredoxin-dependent peroxiredoxin